MHDAAELCSAQVEKVFQSLICLSKMGAIRLKEAIK
jgi:hypothetical protein